MLLKRDSIDKCEIHDKSDIISKRVFFEKAYKEAELILLYASYNSEVETLDIVKKAFSDGKKIAFPKCTFDDGLADMQFYEIDNIDQLSEGYKGILEPDIESNNLKRVEDIADLCIVPGVAFDRSGNRIGYGKGFYDRFISKNGAKCYMGLAFECQLVDKIETETTDMRLDMVITEEKVYVCK